MDTIDVQDVVRAISRELNAARGAEIGGVFVHPDARDALVLAGMVEGRTWFMGVALLVRDDVHPDEPEAANRFDLAHYLESLVDGLNGQQTPTGGDGGGTA